jgi:MFS transporter, DHA3 family, macrolide efflux protein
MIESKKIIYWFLGLQGFSLIGSRITAIAVGIWLVKETGKVTPLLLISLFNELPILFFGTWIGLVVDRWKRKTTIIIGDTGQALCNLILILSIVNSYFEIWHIYVLVAIQGIFMGLQSSSTAAAIPMMVKDEELDRVNSIKELLFPLAGVIAPFIAGMLYEPIGLVGILIIDITTFAVCTGALLFFSLPELKKTSVQKEELWSEAIQGYQFLWKHKPLLYLFLYFAWWNFILNGPLELAVPYFLLTTGSDSGMSILLGIMNAGALTGAAAAVWWGHFHSKINFIFAGSFLTSMMFILMGFSSRIWVTAMAVFLLMLPLAMTGSLFNSLLQRKVPLSMQGRVFTAHAQLSAVTAPLSFLITGPMVDQWLEPTIQSGKWIWLSALVGQEPGAGMSVLFVFCGFLLMTGAIWTFSSAKVRQIETKMPDRTNEFE